MGRKASGKPREYRVKKKQTNGYTYVYQRTAVYSPEKGYCVTVKEKLQGKKAPGSDVILPTRPKAPKGSRKAKAPSGSEAPSGTEVPSPEDTPPEPATARSVTVGAGAIADHIGRVSGIDRDVYETCNEKIAKKIIALARYDFLTGGEGDSQLETWQLTHNMDPCIYPISLKATRLLFELLGEKQSFRHKFFLERLWQLDTPEVLVYDITEILEYGKSYLRSRYVTQKERGPNTEKLFICYSKDRGQPVCFMIAPGNIKDESAISMALDRLAEFGLMGSEIITDYGLSPDCDLSPPPILPGPGRCDGGAGGGRLGETGS